MACYTRTARARCTIAPKTLAGAAAYNEYVRHASLSRSDCTEGIHCINSVDVIQVRPLVSFTRTRAGGFKKKQTIAVTYYYVACYPRARPGRPWRESRTGWGEVCVCGLDGAHAFGRLRE